MTKVVPSLVGVVVLVGALEVASLGPVFGIAACIAVAGLVAVLAVGPERLGHALMIAALFTAPMDDVRPVSAVSFVTFSDLFFAIGIGLLLPRILRNRVKFPSTYLLGAGLLLATGLVASLLAADQMVSLNGFSRLVAASIALPVAVAWWNPGDRTVDVMAGAYVAGMIVSVGVGFKDGPLMNDRYVGLTTHPNFFGLCGLMSLALLIHLLGRVPSNRHWIVYAAGAVCLLGVVESGSRAALLAFVVLVAVYPLVERSAMAGYAILIVGGLMVVVGGVLLGSLGGGGSAIDRLKGDSTTAQSDHQRSGLLETGFHDFLRKPLTGWGFSDNPLASHNVYLEVAVAVGVVGLVAWCLILWSLVRPLFQTELARHRLSYPALAFAFVALLTNGIWDRFVWAAVVLALLVDPVTSAHDPDSPADAADPTVRRPKLELL